jgi:hypothetical protein
MTWWIPVAYGLVLALLISRYAARRPRLAEYPPLARGPFV